MAGIRATLSTPAAFSLVRIAGRSSMRGSKWAWTSITAMGVIVAEKNKGRALSGAPLAS
jgi:hypothetical protein